MTDVYKYVNKSDSEVTVDGVTVAASGAFVCYDEPNIVFDAKSDGLQFDKYLNGFLLEPIEAVESAVAVEPPKVAPNV